MLMSENEGSDAEKQSVPKRSSNRKHRVEQAAEVAPEASSVLDFFSKVDAVPGRSSGLPSVAFNSRTGEMIAPIVSLYHALIMYFLSFLYLFLPTPILSDYSDY